MTTTPQPTAIPRTLLAPSATNPRKHFDAARLAEMRASIERHGILQPLLVRRNANAEGSGQPLYEIVSGERRWRASEGTPVAMGLPCHVLQLDDLAVLEIQVIENVQREDLHPLEEAEGYEHLLLEPTPWAPHLRPRLAGYTIDEIAQRVGKSRSHVYARLRLLGLTPAARYAFLAGEFSTGSALQIARLNTMHQEELVQALLHDAAKGAAWSADTVSHTVQQRYMLRLAGAPFDLHDAALLPAAGSCAACPKRSGANPQLFDDIAEGDTCADRACFAQKCEAFEVAAITLAEERGHSIIDGDEAARLLPTAEATIKGYLRLDRPSEFALSHKPLGEVLGSSARQVALIVRSHGAGVPSTLVEVMPTPIVRQVLKEKGLLKPDAAPVVEKPKARETKPPRVDTKTPVSATKGAAGETKPAASETPAAIDDPAIAAAFEGFEVLQEHDYKGQGKARTGPTDGVLRSRREQALDKARGILIAHRIGAELQQDSAQGFPSEGLSRMVARIAAGFLYNDGELLTAARCVGIDAAKLIGKHGRCVDALIWQLTEEEAARLAIVLLALQEREHGEPDPAETVCAVLNLATVDIEARANAIVENRLRIELQSMAPKTEAKPTAATKSTKAKRPGGNAKPPAKKPAAKYRDALTGSTWSGRGLQPKWLKVALASGRTLTDFDVAQAAAAPPATPATPQLSPAAAWPFPTGGEGTKITAVQLDAARKHVIATRRASVTTIQKALSVSAAHAGKVLDQLELQQVVGRADKDGQREVLVRHPEETAEPIPASDVPY